MNRQETELGRGVFEYTLFAFSWIDVEKPQVMSVGTAYYQAGIPTQIFNEVT
jgi:hypothetical protein